MKRTALYPRMPAAAKLRFLARLMRTVMAASLHGEMRQDLTHRVQSQSRRLADVRPGLRHWLPLWLVAPLLVSASLVFSGLALAPAYPLISVENGPIENGQTALVALTIALNVWIAASVKRTGPRVCHGSLAVFCLAVLVREIDIDRLGSAAAWASVETAIRAAVAAALIVMTAELVRHSRSLFRCVSLSRISLLVAMAVCLYMIGWSVEQTNLIPAAASQLWEELFQLAGAVFFLAASTHRSIDADGVDEDSDG